MTTRTPLPKAMHPTRRRALALSLSLAGLLAAPGAFAQATAEAGFPSRQVKLVVPYPPGGIVDLAARLIGNKLQERWKQPVVVDNRPGASGAIGAEMVATSPADGYTLLVATSSMLLNSLLDPQIRYELAKDFAPVTTIGTSPLVLLSSNEMGVKSVSEFGAALKSSPTKYSYGTIGVGSSLHLYAEHLGRSLSAQPVAVPLKGAALIVNEILAGRLDFSFMDLNTPRQFIDTGKMKALALTGPKRSSLYPSVPTFAESGLAGFDTLSWYGIYAPRGTPPAITAGLAADIAAVLQMPDVASKIAETGSDPAPVSPAEFGRRTASDMQAWSALFKQTKLQAK